MLETLRTYVLGGSEHEVIHECRECGTTVDPDDGSCPDCGADDVVRYELE